MLGGVKERIGIKEWTNSLLGKLEGMMEGCRSEIVSNEVQSSAEVLYEIEKGFGQMNECLDHVSDYVCMSNSICNQEPKQGEPLGGEGVLKTEGVKLANMDKAYGVKNSGIKQKRKKVSFNIPRVYRGPVWEADVQKVEQWEANREANKMRIDPWAKKGATS